MNEYWEREFTTQPPDDRDSHWHNQRDARNENRVLQRMRAVALETYVTWHKLKGSNVESSRRRIEDALDNVDSIADLIELLGG